MDDQAHHSHKKTDHTMTFRKRWGNPWSFKLGTMDRPGYATFTVNYFNKPATYPEGFLKGNQGLRRGKVDHNASILFYYQVGY